MPVQEMRPLASSWCDLHPSIVAQSVVNRLITYMPNHQMVPINRQGAKNAKDYPQITQITQKRKQKAVSSKQ